jgi:transcriptional regulator with XRE-family HTH domain
MRKERLARGWSFQELATRTGINAGHLSRIENGRRPPTEKVAVACDAAFPERRGWFLEYYSELRGCSEVPASFRSWPEYEDGAVRLYDWSPSIVTGLLQTEDYARSLIATLPGVTRDTVAARLAARMERQKRVLYRADPPRAWFIVDELSLYREVGGREVMARQMRHLARVAALPNVTVQVLPALAHPVNASGFMMADDAVWAEHVAGGFVYTDEGTVSELVLRFDTLRGECRRVSESGHLLERMAQAWETGESLLTPTRTAATA